ncbi:REP element-mobilizing transposase RayT [Paucibacter oligotrophus]|uniref:REP element-mobilizing transposase RayT n=1 Tax=Roseateles oligotrophus TaxID=1769250 RepID=A0A840LE37_9BURK|nr:transposase [Roseateles oligotrophus]MBB4845961.1 REP element-mobilizing transposase RayT [Roseateles oligotrophus]
MARPPRIEFPGAAYHVSSRCEPGTLAFADDQDRAVLVELIAQSMQRFDAQLLAYSLLGDQYEILVFTRRANLSRLMRHLGGVYTQHHNRRHGSQGALFHGRFRAVLVDRERHLLDACRYVELAPLRQGLCRSPAQWPWSSFAAHTGSVPTPVWLESDGLWRYVLGRELHGLADRRRAMQAYARLLASDPGFDLWAGRLRQQIFLGDEAFARACLAQATRAEGLARPTRAGKLGRALSLQDWLLQSDSREQALYRAHTEGGLAMSAMARAMDLSVSRVSRIVASYERKQGV